MKLKTFKDEELGLDFTTPNVKSLNDIIKIIKEKESNSENCGKLLFIISEKLSFGKNTSKTHKKNEENKLNNCERKMKVIVLIIVLIIIILIIISIK